MSVHFIHNFLIGSSFSKISQPHLEDSVFDGQDRDVESSAAQIVNQNVSLAVDLKNVEHIKSLRIFDLNIFGVFTPSTIYFIKWYSMLLGKR